MFNFSKIFFKLYFSGTKIVINGGKVDSNDMTITIIIVIVVVGSIVVIIVVIVVIKKKSKLAEAMY